MSFPYYICPDQLFHLWWKPVESAGFTVELMPEELLTRPSRLQYGQMIWSYGIIRDGSATVIVDTMRPAEPSLDEHGRYLVLLPQEGDESCELAASVERILFVSGARKSHGAAFGCKFLYQCPSSLVKEWPIILTERGMQVELTEQQTESNDEGKKVRVAFPQGMASKEASGVSIYTGPGIDPADESSIYYIALDFRDSLLIRLSASQRELLNEIDRTLTTHGAMRVDFRDQTGRQQTTTEPQ